MKFSLDSDGDIDLGNSEWAFLNNTSPEKVSLLIASPDMYEALKAAKDGLYAAFPHASRIRDILRPIIDQVEDALAKAEGRTNAPTN